MSNDGVISILAALIETCGSGHKTFRNAAENVQHHEFRRIFGIFSQQRAQFIKELQAEVDRLQGPSRKDADTFTLLNQTDPLQTLIFASGDSRDEASIISECEQGEADAVRDYQHALEADLPLDVHYVVERQYVDIKDAYDRIRILHRAA